MRTNPVVAAISDSRGVDVQVFERAFFDRVVKKRMESVGVSEMDAYAMLLRRSPEEAESFLAGLNVGYSTFFRNGLTWAVLETLALPRISTRGCLDARHRMTAWSAGCSGGQEAWSIAIMLEEWAAKTGMQPDYHVFGTDISRARLADATVGVYGRDDIAGVRLALVDRYFNRVGDDFVVCDALRERVSFSAFDFLDSCLFCPPASIFGDFDLVLCCNVLIYYDKVPREAMLDKLVSSIAPGGVFATGETERAIVEGTCGLKPLDSYSSVFWKKD